MTTRIVVPCYNEEQRFQAGALNDYLASCEGVHFVLVNDGSTDGTLSVLREFEQRWPNRVTVIDQQPNRGKAEAVRVGMLRALLDQPTYVGYFDADFATPLEAIAEFIEVLDHNPKIDVAMGARVALLGRNINRKPMRHYSGRLFATAASLVLGLPVYDTQCGAKLFRAKPSLRQLFEKPFGSRWIFDVEILARYLTGAGDSTGLYELPLRLWTDVGESRVKPLDYLRAGGEMAAIYRTYQLRRHLTTMLAVLSAPFVRYAGAGGVGTAVHYITLASAVEVVGVSPTPATAIGALTGAGVNYFLNYHLTFASNASHARTLPRFLLVAAIGTVLSGGGMWYLSRRLHVHYLVAQIACTIVVLLLGYLLNKVWTFGPSVAARGAAPAAAPARPSEGATESDRKAVVALESPKP